MDKVMGLIKGHTITAFKSSGMSKAELARRMDVGENAVRRILNPNYPTKLPAMTKALGVLGLEIVISVNAIKDNRS